MSILRSWPLWVNVIGQCGAIWGFFTLMTYTPTYLRTAHGFNVQLIGLFSGLPHFFRIVFAILYSIFIDYLLKNQKLSRTNARKLAGGIATIVGLAYFWMQFDCSDHISCVGYDHPCCLYNGQAR